MATDRTRLSKAVAHMLRHQPWRYELELDEAGWVDLDALVAALRTERRWRSLARADVEEMVHRSAKRRYEIADGRIRALYGHSVPGRIVRELGVPPPVLFHGTAADAATVIRDEGLRPMRRQYVHLSVDRDTAVAVGSRKGDRVAVLVVAAAEAYAAGVPFWRGNEAVWLAEHIPSPFIHNEADPQASERGDRRPS